MSVFTVTHRCQNHCTHLPDCKAIPFHILLLCMWLVSQATEIHGLCQPPFPMQEHGISPSDWAHLPPALQFIGQALCQLPMRFTVAGSCRRWADVGPDMCRPMDASSECGALGEGNSSARHLTSELFVRMLCASWGASTCIAHWVDLV